MCTTSVQNQSGGTEAAEFGKASLPELLSTNQAAEVLNVSPRSICKLCELGKLKAVKVLSVWRVNRDALFEFAGLN